jgi:hypothetical protein
VRESRSIWAYPTILTLHTVGLALLAGLSIAVDLRMLGVARRVPTGEEVEQVQRDIDGCTIDVSITAGDRLSELHDQDSYSYAFATIYLGADDEHELIRKFERALAGLPFEFVEPGE